MPSPFELCPIESLKLDPENPRLPESLHGKPESEILRFLFTSATLEEIAQSYEDNGFFAHEPLIILAQPDEDGRHAVLEGNRRLAALKILLGAPEAEGVRFTGIELAPSRRKELQAIPCFPISPREALHAFLGFRHIGGIKTWDAEAKARYLYAEVERAHATGSVDPFRDVGRRVGSNALGVRNPYVSLGVLKHAHEQFGIDSTYVQLNRFGVWLRAINSPLIRSHIGLSNPRTYDEVRAAFQGVRPDNLREVLADLSPQGGRKKALLADSRQVTDYARVLSNEDARQVLRKYEDLTVAAEVIDKDELSTRVRRLAESCKLLLADITRAEPSDALLSATQELFEVARSLNSIATGLKADATHRG